MSNYLAVKSMNYRRTVLGKFDTYQEAKDQVDLAASSHRAIYGSDNTLSKAENSASNYPYKIEFTEMTHEAGLINYVEKWNNDELSY